MEEITIEADDLEFGEKPSKGSAKPQKATKPKAKNNKLALGITVLIAGVLALAAGIVFLVMTLSRGPATQDAEYLVSVGSWEREDTPGVIWKFTEIGKGSLTTNAHMNDYDFIWAMEGNKLKIETNWLYTLNDEYSYVIKDDKLILNDNIVFVPVTPVPVESE